MLWFWYLAGSFKQIVVIMNLWSPHPDKALSCSDWRYCFSIFQKFIITPHLVLLSSWQTMVSSYLITCVSKQFPGEPEKIKCDANHCLSESHSIFSERCAELVASFPFTCTQTVTTGMKVSHIFNNFNESVFSHLCLAPVQPAEFL